MEWFQASQKRFVLGRTFRSSKCILFQTTIFPSPASANQPSFELFGFTPVRVYLWSTLKSFTIVYILTDTTISSSPFHWSDFWSLHSVWNLSLRFNSTFSKSFQNTMHCASFLYLFGLLFFSPMLKKFHPPVPLTASTLVSFQVNKQHTSYVWVGVLPIPWVPYSVIRLESLRKLSSTIVVAVNVWLWAMFYRWKDGEGEIGEEGTKNYG